MLFDVCRQLPVNVRDRCGAEALLKGMRDVVVISKGLADAPVGSTRQSDGICGRNDSERGGTPI